MAANLYPPSQLDHSQVLKYAFNEDTQRLRTEGAANINVNGDLEVAIDAATDSIRIADKDANELSSTNNGGKQSLDVNVTGGVVTGTFTASGLSKGIKTTSMIVTDVAQAVPPLPLLDRNSMSVRVVGSNTVYFGNDMVTSVTGYPKEYREEIILDIKDNASVELYAVCDAGQTCELRIIELA